MIESSGHSSLSNDTPADATSHSWIATLRRTGLLDSAAEEAFDRLTRLASKILHVPVALVSLVDEERQFFKSQVGLAEPWASQRQTPLTHSFCRHVVGSQKPLIVADAREHPLLQDNLAVRDLGVVAYAGLPLTTSDGHTLGAFCAIDGQPHEWTSEEVEILRDLTAAAITEIQLKLSAQDAREQAESALRERNEKSMLLDATVDGIFGLDLEGRCTFINQAAARMLGYSPDDVLNRNFHELVHHRRPDGSLCPPQECPILIANTQGNVSRGEDELFWRKDGSSFPVEYRVSPIYEEGQRKGSVVTISDFTSRKLTIRRLAIQHAVSDVLARTTNFREAAPRLLQSLGETLRWQFGAIWQVDPEIHRMRCVATWTAQPGSLSRFEAATRNRTFAKGVGFPGNVWTKGEPVWFSDAVGEKNFCRSAEASAEGLRSAMIFPIHSGIEVLAVVEFFGRAMSDIDSDLLRTIKTAGYQIGQFIQREWAQEELRTNEALKSAITNTAMDCIVVMDMHGNVLEWNPAAERTFGYRRDQVLGRAMTDFIIPPESRAAHWEGLRKYLATKEGPIIGRRIEVTGMRSDGTEFPVELTISPVSQPGGPIFTGYIRDITDRKRAESQQQEQVRLATLSADIGTAVTQSDQLSDMLQRCAESLVRHLDCAFARIWNFNPDEKMLELVASAGMYTHLNGAHGRIPLGKFKIGMIAQDRKPHLTNAVIGDPRVPHQAWAKQEGIVAFAGYPLVVGEELMGVMGMFARQALSEVSLQAMATVANGVSLGIQRLRTQEELKQSIETAERANEAKSQFLANMSHELRTPLNAVILYSELLMEEAEDRQMEAFLPDLEKIRNAGRHLLVLINDILDLSKIEAGKMDLFVEEFDANAMINEVVSTVRPLFQKRSNELVVQCPAELGQMRSDSTKVRQILFNLLSNAAKFTDKGTVSLDARRETIGGKPWIEIQVRDTGVGMSDEQLRKLFQAFTQADASTTRKYGGTGLGLAITRRLCEMLRGTVQAESTPGQGSLFSVQLPMQVESELAEEESTEPLSQPSRGDSAGTVLVIDDDPAVRETMARFLRKEGYRAITASDGEQGLLLAKQVRPDVITLDVMMSRIDGWSVLASLKADPQLSATPVIMVTIVDERNMGYLLGATEYLTKPIDRVRLFNLLKKYRPQQPDCRVLVVEDDDASRHMLTETLQEQGWKVEGAVNGQSALDKISEAPPNLILLDLLMPEMDGFQFISELASRESWREIPVIVITAKDLSAEERARLNGNVRKILHKKNYNSEDLLSEIRELMRRCVPPRMRPERSEPTQLTSAGSSRSLMTKGGNEDS